MSNNQSYTWRKISNGFGSIATVNLEVTPNNLGQNVINENYSESVNATGYDSWKVAARKGLKYAFSLIEANWTVTINCIEGRATDTNPAIVGYTTMRAFFEKIHFQLSQVQTEELEKFVLSSWRKPYKEPIPDFFNLTFSEFR